MDNAIHRKVNIQQQINYASNLYLDGDFPDGSS